MMRDMRGPLAHGGIFHQRHSFFLRQTPLLLLLLRRGSATATTFRVLFLSRRVLFESGQKLGILLLEGVHVVVVLLVEQFLVGLELELELLLQTSRVEFPTQNPSRREATHRGRLPSATTTRTAWHCMNVRVCVFVSVCDRPIDR